MAMQFSQGLLGGLRQFGQGNAVPTDPRQQNAMQRAGVTNPLLQQFGQSLGGLFGQDMRSQADQFAEAATTFDTTTPEGRKQYLAALMKYKPEEAVKQAMLFKQQDLRQQEYELNKRKTEEDIARGNVTSYNYTIKVPARNKITGDILRDEEGNVIYEEKNMQGTRKKIDGEWYKVTEDENGKLVPERKMTKEEVNKADEADATAQGTVIMVNGKQVPVIVEGDYYVAYENGEKIRYPKDSYDVFKESPAQETIKPPVQPPVQKPVQPPPTGMSNIDPFGMVAPTQPINTSGLFTGTGNVTNSGRRGARPM